MFEESYLFQYLIIIKTYIHQNTKMVYSSDDTCSRASLGLVEQRYTAIETSLNKVCDQMDDILQEIGKVQTCMLHPEHLGLNLTDLETHLSNLKIAYDGCYHFAARKSEELRDLHFQREIARSHNRGHLMQAPSVA